MPPKEVNTSKFIDNREPAENEKDVIEFLKKKEEEDKISDEQRSIIDLMVDNKNKTQYKKALNKTIETIRAGVVENTQEVNNG